MHKLVLFFPLLFLFVKPMTSNVFPTDGMLHQAVTGVIKADTYLIRDLEQDVQAVLPYHYHFRTRAVTLYNNTLTPDTRFYTPLSTRTDFTIAELETEVLTLSTYVGEPTYNSYDFATQQTIPTAPQLIAAWKVIEADATLLLAMKAVPINQYMVEHLEQERLNKIQQYNHAVQNVEATSEFYGGIPYPSLVESLDGLMSEIDWMGSL